MGTSTYLTEQTRLQNFSGLRDANSLVVLKQFLDDAYQELASAHDWSWLHHEDTLSLEASYSEGTISVSEGSTAVTLTGGTWNTGWTNREILIGTELYSITVATTSTGTLARAAVKAASGSTYIMFRRKYSLAARMRSGVEFSTFSTAPQPIDIVSPERYGIYALETLSPRDPPIVVCFTDQDSGSVSQVKFWPPPQNAGSVYYSGTRDPANLTADGDTYLFPPRILPVFRLLATSKMWGYRKDPRSESDLRKYMLAVTEAIESDPPSGGRHAKMELAPSTYFRNRAPTFPGRHSSGF